jgi:uncharacterized protein YukJ
MFPGIRSVEHFKCVPGNGVHDIHKNQETSGHYEQDNGVYEDGALTIAYAFNRWRALSLRCSRRPSIPTTKAAR